MRYLIIILFFALFCTFLAIEVELAFFLVIIWIAVVQDLDTKDFLNIKEDCSAKQQTIYIRKTKLIVKIVERIVILISKTILLISNKCK